MAGIIANAASAPVMASGDTSADNTRDNFVTAEAVSLSTSPTGSSYVWELSIPTGSATARSALSSTTSATPTFTPDVAGQYLIRVTVDSATEYSLRITVTAATPSIAIGGILLLPKTDASIPTPSTGRTLYNSSTQNGLAVKDSGGTVSTVDVTSV